MIILEAEQDQLPKLPTDPVQPGSSTHRTHHLPPPPSPTYQRPSSPNPTLPDYETSEAQHLLSRSRGKSPRARKVCKLVWYAVFLYTGLFIVVGIPWTFLRRHTVYHRGEPLFDYVPPPHANLPHTKVLSDESTPVAMECNAWTEHRPLPGASTTDEGAASLKLGIMLGDAIILRANGTADQWRDRVFGRLKVDINPDANATASTLQVTAAFTHRSLFKNTSVCRTKTSTSSRITISIPNETSETVGARILFDIQLLLPSLPLPAYIEELTTYLPFFEQEFGDLGSDVIFGGMHIEGLSSKITFGAIKAASLHVKTSEAEIYGTFNISESLTLDTINGPIDADVTMYHDEHVPLPMALSMESGNAPIVANLSLLVRPRLFDFTRPKKNFVAKARTFNAPIDLTVTHVTHSARLALQVLNTQGPVNVSLDAPYTGTFDLQAKSSLATLDERPVWGDAAAVEDTDGVDRVMAHDYVSTDRLLGWVGWGRRPSPGHRQRQSHVEIVSSLSPVGLRLDKPGSLVAVRRR